MEFPLPSLLRWLSRRSFAGFVFLAHQVFFLLTTITPYLNEQSGTIIFARQSLSFSIILSVSSGVFLLPVWYVPPISVHRPPLIVYPSRPNIVDYNVFLPCTTHTRTMAYTATIQSGNGVHVKV